jgi:hypothetical protein
MATTGQKNLIRTIMSERELEAHHVEWVNDRLDRADTALVQTIMSRLKALPRRQAQGTLAVDVVARERVAEEGFYKADDGDVYKVVRSQVGRLYAKQTTARGLAYVEGAMAKLFADQKMTGEEIAAHGVANHYCVNCSAELTDPTSQHVGLGTSCGPAILGKEGYKAAKVAVAHFADVIAFEVAKKAEAKTRREDKKAAAAQQELAVATEAAPASRFEAIYFAMADLGFDDTQIRDARYGAGNW